MNYFTNKIQTNIAKKTVTYLAGGTLVLGLVLASASVSMAGPHSGGAEHGHEKAGSMHGAKDSAGHGAKHSAGHGAKHSSKKGKHQKKKGHGTFTPHWAKTLTDEQKLSFDKMHLAVGQFEAVQRAKLKMLKAELNVLVAKEMNNKSFIYAKIDEILDVKKGLMRNRYDHIAEMRAELTDQQRISYDMGTLKRGKHKH